MSNADIRIELSDDPHAPIALRIINGPDDETELRLNEVTATVIARGLMQAVAAAQQSPAFITPLYGARRDN